MADGNDILRSRKTINADITAINREMVRLASAITTTTPSRLSGSDPHFEAVASRQNELHAQKIALLRERAMAYGE